MSITYAFDMDRLPEYLYHGTDCSNIPPICTKGILTGTFEQKGKKLNVKEKWKTCDLWKE